MSFNAAVAVIDHLLEFLIIADSGYRRDYSKKYLLEKRCSKVNKVILIYISLTNAYIRPFY